MMIIVNSAVSPGDGTAMRVSPVGGFSIPWKKLKMQLEYRQKCPITILTLS